MKCKTIISFLTAYCILALSFVTVPLCVNAVPGSWTFDNGAEGWVSANANESTVSFKDGIMVVNVTGIDPALSTQNDLNLPTDTVKKIKVRMKNETKGTKAQFYYLTKESSAWGEDKHIDFDITANDSDFKEYVIDMTEAPGWKGTLTCLRLDPTSRSTGKVYIDKIELVGVEATAISLNQPDASVAVEGPEPYIAGKSMETDDYIIATVNAKDEVFGAKGDGEADDTQAIQKALNKAAEMGGGIVFLPSGMYKVSGNLTIPGTVTLRGQWKNPINGGSGKGTILMAYAGRGDAEGTPFIMAKVSSCIMDLSIWYPEQRFDNILPYPWTIGYEGVSVTARNITLYNSYQGIHTALVNGSAQHAKNIYGTVLKQGMIMDMNLEVSDYVSIYFNNDIWAGSGLPGSPAKEEQKKILRSYTSQNATGITLGRNDDIFLYDIQVNKDDFLTGIRMIKTDHPAPFGGGAYGHLIRLHDTTTKIEATSQWTNLSIADDVGGTEKFQHIFAPERRPESDKFYNVRKEPYNAKGDGKTDDFKAIQEALNTAGANGGGTVFLPVGQYKISGELVVPSGVELRGAFEEIHHVMDKTSTELLAYAGRGSEDGKAFITLEAHSGLHGVTISYPEQIMGTDYVPYPWTVKGEGEKVWVEYVTILNGYNLINLYDKRCDDFVVKGVWATALNKGIAIGGGSSNGTMEYNFTTYGVWMETARKSGTSEASELKSYYAQASTAFVFGDSSGIKALSNFAFGSKNGVIFSEQNGRYCRDSIFFRLGLDQPSKSSNIILQAADGIHIVGLSTASHKDYIFTEATFKGTVNIYGINQWGGGANKVSHGKVNIIRWGLGLFKENQENIAYGKSIQSSSNKWGGFRAEDSIDGLRQTTWISDNKAEPHWIMLDLNGDYSIKGWKVLHAGFNGEEAKLNTKDFKLQVSLDGKEWSDADGVTGNQQPITERELKKSVRARFVRLYVDGPVQEGAEDTASRIAEFMVFGKLYDEAAELKEKEIEEKEGRGSDSKMRIVFIAFGIILVGGAGSLFVIKKTKKKAVSKS